MFVKIRKGSAIVMVICIMAILTILAASLFSVSLAETKQASWLDNRTQAHYIARSGIYFGFDLMDSQLKSKNYPDINTLITDLNEKVTHLTTDDLKISDKGSFALAYVRFDSESVKIISTGTSEGMMNQSETVTLIVKVIPSMAMEVNPSLWINGINLIKDFTSGSDFLGKGIRLEAKPIQSPQGSNKISTFMASIIYFADHSGLSFKQITNSVPITFDSEVIYFESGVQLNKTSDPVKLTVSTNVLQERTDMTKVGVLPRYSKVEGFESYDMYKNFIGTLTVDNYNTSYKSKFIPGANYGIVRFGGDVYKNDSGNPSDSKEIVITKGFYFFKSGVDLQDPTKIEGKSGSYENLIKISDDDAVIKALNNLFKSSAITDGHIWNRK